MYRAATVINSLNASLEKVDTINKGGGTLSNYDSLLYNLKIALRRAEEAREDAFPNAKKHRAYIETK